MVVDGVDRLREGAAVELIERPDFQAPPAAKPAAAAGGRAAAPAGAPRRADRDRRSAADMNPSRLFILRPVATTLLMLAIVIAGAIAYRMLPVSALPQVDYPTIQVYTFYPGASPEVMTSSVTAPLERQFGQIPGVKQMTSTSSGGASIITLQFDLAVALDVAEQGVQSAINAASNLVPSDLPAPPVYSKVNPADAPIVTLALTSATLPLPQVQNLADTRFAQKLSQVPGVGLVTLSGGQRPAVRIQANPQALAANGLGMEGLRSAIVAANVKKAKGNFDGADPRLQHRRQRPAAFARGVPRHRRRLARAARRSTCRTWPRSWRMPRTCGLRPG